MSLASFVVPVDKLSIIIVSYNARADLERCLASLHDSPPATPHEIVVVDNASSDGSAEAARGWTGVRVIDAGANVGFAGANNIGIHASCGDLLLLLNSDTIVPPHAIDRLVARMDRDAATTVIGPRLVDENGRAELSFGDVMGPWNELRQKAIGWLGARSGLVEHMARQERTPDWVSGACLLVRRADAEAVGLLDERYFMYAEDVDFCAAIRARGGTVRFVPEVEIVHLRGRSRAAAATATERAYRRSQVAFYEKHHPNWAPLLRLYLKLRGADI